MDSIGTVAPALDPVLADAGLPFGTSELTVAALLDREAELAVLCIFPLRAADAGSFLGTG
jgi:hypothetical protein